MITRKDIARRMREVLKDGREQRRELTLEAKYEGDQGCLDASGAINLTVRDILPTLEGDLQLPQGLEIETGVTGNEVWPVSINDVEIEEEDEVGVLTEQSLGFAQTRGAYPVRTGITVEVSNQAIDSAAFDLLGFIQRKFRLAQRRYIVQHLYSNARWDGNNGPFSGEYASRWVIPEGSWYESIMAQMTLLELQGYDTREAVIVMDELMEVRLKCTPIVPEEGRMVIQNGLCCGYPYVVSKYFDTELNEDGKLVRKNAEAIGIGIFKYFKIAQHGTARVTIDGVSEEVASRNVTAITLNTAWSFTNLSDKINGGSGVQAFRTLIVRQGYLRDCNELVLRSSDGYLLRVGLSGRSLVLADSNGTVLLTKGGEELRVDMSEPKKKSKKKPKNKDL